MKNAMLWGLSGGLLGFVFLALLPQPYGSVVWFVVVAIYALAGAVVVWRRTGLGWATAGIVVSAAGALLMARLQLFDDWLVMPALGWLLGAMGLVFLTLLCAFVETARNHPAWQRWEEELERVALWEMLLFRQVPVVRPDEETRG